MTQSQKNLVFVPPNVATMGGIPMSTKEFMFFKELIENLIGINLTEQKLTLVQSRLGRRMRELGFDSYKQYIDLLQNDPMGREVTHFINALTTNKTEFFRENAHFDYLKNYLTDMFHHQTCYLWSAACSNGSEVYTLNIICEELKRDYPHFDYRILGSDIDTQMLQKASSGIYHKTELVGLPPLYLSHYFERGLKQHSGTYRFRTDMRHKLKFKNCNLVDDNDNFSFQFDVIFLRNVLIYFSKDTITKVIEKMWRHLKPNGILFIGHSENLHGLSHRFEAVGSSVYRAKK
jgi:chemotaxis protein methyltransferase CheR